MWSTEYFYSKTIFYESNVSQKGSVIKKVILLDISAHCFLSSNTITSRVNSSYIVLKVSSNNFSISYSNKKATYVHEYTAIHVVIHPTSIYKVPGTVLAAVI